MSLQVWLPLNGSLDEKINNKNISAAAGLSLPTSGATGKLGPGYTFSNNGIQISSLKTYKTMSFALWLKLTSHNLCHIIDYRHPIGEAGYQPIYYGTDSQGRWGIQIHTSGGGGQNEYIPIQLSTNIWYHLCVIMQNNLCSLYIDGTLIGNTTISSFTMLDNIDTTLSIGCRCSGTNPCPGIIQDVRIYDHCLSPREVKLLAQGLIVHYKLDGNEIENPNLVNGSYGDVTSTEYMLHRYTFDKTGFGRYLAEGEQCTLTVCFTPGVNFSYFNPCINNGHMGGWMPNILASGTEKQIVTVTSSPSWKYSYTIGDTNYTNPNNAPSMADVCMFNKNTSGGNGSTGTVIHWIKLQLGYHPEVKTWTPSISENPNQYLLEDDCSGYGNHATCSSPFGLTSDAPRYKNCKNFENNKYVDCGKNIKPTDAFTVSCWANVDWSNSNGQLISCTEGGGWGIGKGANALGSGKEGFEIYSNSDKKYYGINFNYNSLSSGWHHFVATYNGSVLQGFIDGNIVKNGNSDTWPAGSDFIYPSANTGLLIGAEPGASENSRYLNGKMSDVRIYATALSAAAVKELYQSSISFLDNGTLQCSEIVESSTNLKYNQNGIVQTTSFKENTTQILKMFEDNSIQTYQIYEL